VKLHLGKRSIGFALLRVGAAGERGDESLRVMRTDVRNDVPYGVVKNRGVLRA
jgi:hypothetical protein